jgi:hypothetical protein
MKSSGTFTPPEKTQHGPYDAVKRPKAEAAKPYRPIYGYDKTKANRPKPKKDRPKTICPDCGCSLLVKRLADHAAMRCPKRAVTAEKLKRDRNEIFKPRKAEAPPIERPHKLPTQSPQVQATETLRQLAFDPERNIGASSLSAATLGRRP